MVVVVVVEGAEIAGAAEEVGEDSPIPSWPKFHEPTFTLTLTRGLCVRRCKGCWKCCGNVSEGV